MSAKSSLDEKVVRTSPVLWILGFVFALFLCGLGSQILEDIAQVIPAPRSDTYYAQARALQAERDALSSAPNPRAAQLARAQRDLDNQERVLSTAEESWRTWLQTRATLGKQGNEDAEVRVRRNRLDALRQERDSAEKTLADLKAQPDPREVKLQEYERRIADAEHDADRQYSMAMAGWRWRVLGARLGLVIPVWALAVFLWGRRQQTRYVTLLWGYLGFAAWMLLYGVIPYLPQYGGYVPLLLGAVTTVWIAVSLVRFFNQRVDQRRRRIVDRAIARHQCPGCERDYLIGREAGLDAGLARKATVTHYDAESLRPRSCPACGLPLFGPCQACGHVQLVHQEYCAVCGTGWQSAAPAPVPAPAPV